VHQEANNPALGHCVYGDLLDCLPVASVEQTNNFMANLRLPWETRHKRFLNLRVSPEIGETGYRGLPPERMLQLLESKYGERLNEVSGFYRDAGGRQCINLPRGCALYGYRSEFRMFEGILCQPLDRLEEYFLFSSARFGGPKASRLSRADEEFFRCGRSVLRAAA